MGSRRHVEDSYDEYSNDRDRSRQVATYNTNGQPVREYNDQRVYASDSKAVLGPFAGLKNIAPHFPLLCWILVIALLITCLIIGTINNREYGIAVPYLADIGKESPEYFISAIGFAIVGIVILGGIHLLNYYLSGWMIRHHYLEQGLFTVNTACLLCGLLSSLSLALAAILDRTRYHNGHRAMSIAFTVTTFAWVACDVILHTLIALSLRYLSKTMASRMRLKIYLALLLLVLFLWLYPVSMPLLCDVEVYANCTGLHIGRSVTQYITVIVLLIYLAIFAGAFREILNIAFGNNATSFPQPPALPPTRSRSRSRTKEAAAPRQPPPRTASPPRRKPRRKGGFYLDNDGATPRVVRYTEGSYDDATTDPERGSRRDRRGSRNDGPGRSRRSRIGQLFRPSDYGEDEYHSGSQGREGSPVYVLERKSNRRRRVGTLTPSRRRGEKPTLVIDDVSDRSADDSSSYDSVYSDDSAVPSMPLRPRELRPMPGQSTLVRVPERPNDLQPISTTPYRSAGPLGGSSGLPLRSASATSAPMYHSNPSAQYQSSPPRPVQTTYANEPLFAPAGSRPSQPGRAMSAQSYAAYDFADANRA